MDLIINIDDHDSLDSASASCQSYRVSMSKEKCTSRSHKQQAPGTFLLECPVWFITLLYVYGQVSSHMSKIFDTFCNSNRLCDRSFTSKMTGWGVVRDRSHTSKMMGQ